MSEVKAPERLRERCPACGNESLMIDSAGLLVCTLMPSRTGGPGCPDPTAAHDRLAVPAPDSPDREPDAPVAYLWPGEDGPIPCLPGTELACRKESEPLYTAAALDEAVRRERERIDDVLSAYALVCVRPGSPQVRAGLHDALAAFYDRMKESPGVRKHPGRDTGK